MDEREKRIKRIEQFLKEAKSNIHSVEQMLKTLAAEEKSGKISSKNENGIEGVFNGEKMIDVEGKSYVVPENYASKSKLVKGDVLRMINGENGESNFQQISKTGRKKIQGKLMNEGSYYKVFTEGKSYKVLNAAVNFFSLTDNDDVEIIVPLEGDSEWAAVEQRIGGAASESQNTAPLQATEEGTTDTVIDSSVVPETTIPPSEENLQKEVDTPADTNTVSSPPDESLNIDNTVAPLIHDLKTENDALPQQPQANNPQNIQREQVIGTAQPQNNPSTAQNSYDLDKEDNQEVVYKEDNNESGDLSTFHNQEQNQADTHDKELAGDILDRPSNNTANSTGKVETGPTGQGVKELDI